MPGLEQFNLGCAFLAGAQSLEALDASVFSDSEARRDLGLAMGVLGGYLKKEEAMGLSEEVCRVQAALKADPEFEARSAALRLAEMVNGKKGVKTERGLENARRFFGERPAADPEAMMEKIRRAKRGHAFGAHYGPPPMECLVRDCLSDWFDRHGSPEIPKEWKMRVGRRFGRKMAGALPADRLNYFLIAGIAEKLNQELLLFCSDDKTGKLVPYFIHMMDIISAGQILEIRKEAGDGLIPKVAFCADPVGKAKQYKGKEKKG